MILATGEGNKDHYLLADPVTLAESAVIQFEYFLLGATLTLYDSKSGEKLWSSGGRETQSWEDAAADIGSGDHQVATPHLTTLTIPKYFRLFSQLRT